MEAKAGRVGQRSNQEKEKTGGVETALRTVGEDRIDVKTATTAALRAEMGRALKVTAEHLAYMATIWKELENRGEDLSEYKAGVGEYLSQIASGEIIPELVARYLGEIGTLRRLRLLPRDDQVLVLTEGLPWPERVYKQQKRRASVSAAPDDKGEPARMPNEGDRMIGVAKNGGVRDVCMLIIEMVKASADPAILANEIAHALGNLGYLNVVD